MKTPKTPNRPPGAPWTPPRNLKSAKPSSGGKVVSAIVLLALAGGGGWWMLHELESQRQANGGQPVAESEEGARVLEIRLDRPPGAETSSAGSDEVAVVDDAPTERITIERPDLPMPVLESEREQAAAGGNADPSAPRAEIFEKLENHEPLVLTGINATATPVVALDQEILREVANYGAWDEYRELLERSLAGVIDTLPEARRGDRFEPLWQEAVLYQAFLRQQVLSRFPASTIRQAEQAPGFLRWFLHQNEPMEELLLTLHPDDDPDKVLSFISEAYYVTGEELGAKYINLAIACAVVFDRPLRIEADLSASASEPQREVNPWTRYHWYVNNSEANRLVVPAHRSSARDLVWVVCAPVPESELDWAVDNMRLRRQRWGEAYGMVEYLMERAVNGLNPYDEYSLAEILDKGGICGDQSYFCANTARANGIPAVILSGETDLGPHAWVAAKTEPDEWNTLIGRIGGVADGGGGNPQTGGRISEQEIWLWNERDQKSRTTTMATFRLLWLSDLLAASERPELQEEAVLAANRVGRAFSQSWARLHDHMATQTREADEETAASMVDQWIDFVSRMRAQFRDNPRMAATASQAEMEFIFPHLPEAEARRILARERRRIERNSGEQADLIADSLRTEAELIAAGGADDAKSQIANLYSSALRNYGGSITGFKRMAEDYFGFVREDQETARQAARHIELAFFRVVETGTRDWFRANTEVSIYKMICDYYRVAGDETRAASLERRYERTLRQAERGALR